MRPLFIPLKRCYFESFERGDKTTEYRKYGARWNEHTCALGRPVTLSLGYGKARRLQGRIVDFMRINHVPAIEGWRECYGEYVGPAAVIEIELHRSTP